MKIKKLKGQKSVKAKYEFKDCRHCSEASQLENKIDQLEENKLDVGSFRENYLQ